MILPHVLKRITLHLARLKEFPSGSASHGYEFVAPLDPQGHIDAHLWQKYREHCGVRRFWNGDDEQIGRLVHKPGGAEHARWVFDYDAASTDDDEAGHRFGVRLLRSANTFQSATMRMSCTPFGLREWSPPLRPNGLDVNLWSETWRLRQIHPISM